MSEKMYFEFSDVDEAANTLKELGYKVVKKQGVFPDPIPEDYPMNELGPEPYPYTLALITPGGCVAFSSWDDTVVHKCQDELRKALESASAGTSSK